MAVTAMTTVMMMMVVLIVRKLDKYGAIRDIWARIYIQNIII